MIYLRTGTNGASKTLFTLWDVRQVQVKENRPVFYRGFTPKAILLEEFGWKEFTPEKWQECPDGSILIWDEAQECFPNTMGRGTAPIPQWVQDIAKYRRKRGMDFYICTPGPGMLCKFVRDLIEKPSYHIHMKRMYGAQLVSEIRFGYCELQCAQPGSSAKGEITTRAFPKEAFAWYESASLHTAQKRLPKQLYIGVAVIPLVIGLAWYATHWIAGIGARTESRITGKPAAAAGGVASVTAPGVAAGVVPTATRHGEGPRILTTGEYVQVRMPRIEGLAYTAPAYDQVTQPSVAPYPAACVQSTSRCSCFTQQGTRLTVPEDMCLQIVRNGFFVDWQQAQAAPAGAVAAPAAAPARQAAAGPTPIPPAPAVVPPGRGPALLSAPGETAPVMHPPLVVSEPGLEGLTADQRVTALAFDQRAKR